MFRGVCAFQSPFWIAIWIRSRDSWISSGIDYDASMMVIAFDSIFAVSEMTTGIHSGYVSVFPFFSPQDMPSYLINCE